MNKKTLFFLALLCAGLPAGFYFQGEIFNFFKDKIHNFQKTEIGFIVSESASQFLAPLPLNMGGSGNAEILVKSKIIQETNFHRQQNGLPPLKENTLLSDAAVGKVNDMFEKQYFEHESPDGVGPGSLVQEYGYDYITAGENLILGNFDNEVDVVQNWMDSQGHRENILNKKFTEIGVAILKGTYKGQTVWIGVQEFGLPLSSCQKANADLKRQIDENRVSLDVIFDNLEETKDQIESANANSAVYKQMAEDYNSLVGRYNDLAGRLKDEISEYNRQVNAFNVCAAQ